MNSSINRALIFQGGGSLGAYEAGAYKAISEELSAYFRTVGYDIVLPCYLRTYRYYFQ